MLIKLLPSPYMYAPLIIPPSTYMLEPLVKYNDELSVINTFESVIPNNDVISREPVI